MKSKNFIIFLCVLIILLYLSQYVFPEPKVEEIEPPTTIDSPQQPEQNTTPPQ